MFRQKARYSTAALGLALSLGAATVILAQDGTPAYRNKRVVYVETNNPEAGQNAILAFRRETNGQLTQLPGSPYRTGGTGVRDATFSLATFANDTPVIANRQRTLLFAVNEGSNSIAVFRIGGDGGLQDVAGSPFPSGGFQPVSLGLVGDVLTVANKNGDPAQASVEANAQPNYTTFRVGRDGALLPTGSTVTATASPSQAIAIPQSEYRDLGAFGYDRERGGDDLGFVFGADFAGGRLQSFEVGRSGNLVQNQPQALPAQLFAGKTFLGGPAPPFPLGLAIHPRFPILYVGLVTVNQIGVYVFGTEGKLDFVDAASNPAPTNCWLLINKAATRMYAVDTLTNQLTTFDIGTDPLVPTALAVTTLRGTGRSFELALSDDDRYLYVISQQGDATGSVRDNTLHVLQVSDDGNSLSEIQTLSLSSFLSGTAPGGIRWQGVVAF